MSKAEQFIKDCTRSCSNLEVSLDSDIVCSYAPWITPEQALRAVEIAREEMIDKACKWLKSYRQDTPDGTGYIPGIINDETIEEFKKAMEE